MEEYEDFTFLSITTRTTLCDQHMTSFKTIDIQHYQTCTDMMAAEALTICLNSLHKLEEIEEADMKNCIIYIDEVKAFLEMTHNKTLDSRLKQTMEI